MTRDPAPGATLLVFELAGHRLALPAGAVRECLPLPALFRRPGSPAAVAGFFFLGAAAVAVVDLAVLFGLRPAEAPPFGEQGGVYRPLLLLDGMALLVDRVATVAPFARGVAEARADGWQHGCVSARVLVDGEAVALLDPDRILLLEERERLSALRTAEREREAGWADRGRRPDGA
ncbi:MAG: chemotaxis protein CheW [Gluconacetobacter diazotrophicus]|nr:chemotaxis protein CheW [Gluconacetobacter diazotrophicus]